jgi:transcriptional regulator with XRE-family HTH domain
LTQEKLIELLKEKAGYKVTPSTLSFWENGKSYPPNEAIDTLAEVFGDSSLQGFKRVSVAEINRIAGQLTTDQQNVVYQFALSLASQISQVDVDSELRIQK